MVQIDARELEQIVLFLKVLADKSRFRLIALLSEREYTVGELAKVLELKEPTVSWHVTMLRNHDMVEMRQEGTSHFYKLKQEGVHALLKDLKSKVAPEEALDAGSDFERHVLETFFQPEGVKEYHTPDGTFQITHTRLKEIPTQRKKQIVVLERLAQEFVIGQRYSEEEINTILKRFHPDCATLRRQMVDNHIMHRENSIYWRENPSAESV